MPCPPFETLSAYADQALAPAARPMLAQHLVGCAHCRQQLAHIQQLQSLVQALPTPALGYDLAARLPDLLPSPHMPGPRSRPRWGWISAGASVAALACGVWLGGLLLAGTTTPAPLRSGVTRVFGPVPPGGLCAAAELCTPSKGMP